MKNSLGSILVILAICLSCRGQAASSDLWLQDFEILKRELASGYANLEWSAATHHLDLAALSRDTEAQLSKAGSAGKARKIIERFLDAFQDPHLKAKQQNEAPAAPSSEEEWQGPSAAASTKDALAALGYRKSATGFALDFRALDGFTEIKSPGNPFPAGVLELDDGRTIGVVRIDYFGEDRYYDLAATVWPEFQLQLEGPCKSACWWEFTHKVRIRLLAALQERIESLQSAGAQALLVDVTGNGGGSEWCEAVAQMFSGRPLAAPGVGMVKHPHWVGRLQKELTWLEADLSCPDLTEEMRRILETTRQQHERLLQQVETGCDPATTWHPELSSSPCERVVEDRHGMYEIPAGAATLVDSLKSENLLFRSSTYPEFTGVYEGRLFVVIDTGSASATEQFATLLQYNDVATLLGETSYGAGCGYTNGGIRLYLPHVQLRVWMPDCMRYRADGENERAGVVPDAPGWDVASKGKERARALRDVLAARTDW